MPGSWDVTLNSRYTGCEEGRNLGGFGSEGPSGHCVAVDRAERGKRPGSGGCRLEVAPGGTSREGRVALTSAGS